MTNLSAPASQQTDMLYDCQTLSLKCQVKPSQLDLILTFWTEKCKSQFLEFLKFALRCHFQF